MITFELESGRSITADAYEYSRTYLELMEGLPNARLNRRILDEAQKKARTLWGKRKVYLVSPECDRTDPEHPVLPPAQYIAWLTCPEPVDPKFMASELVAVFYSGLPEDTPIPEVFRKYLEHLNWEHLAHDFDW